MATKPTKSIMEKLAEQYFVKVTKGDSDDDRNSIVGSPFISPRSAEHDGTSVNGVKVPYAIVPIHTVDYLKTQFKHYVFSEPFIPAEQKADVKK